MRVERLQISNSMLATVADCPTRAVLRLLGRGGTEPNASLECGKRVHEVLANYLRGSGPDTGILDPITVAYKAWCEQHLTSEDRRWWENVRNILEVWMERHPIHELPFTIESADHIEVEFIFPLGEAKDGTPIDVIGNLDGIVKDKLTSGRYILEHKTTGRFNASFKADFQFDPQNTEYLWAASQTLGEPVYASYVNAIQISTLPSDPTRRCKEHHKTYDICGKEHVKEEMFPVVRTPDDIKSWRENALVLSGRLLRLARLAQSAGDEAGTRVPTLGRISGACSYCEFKTWCLTNNRQLALIDTLAPKQTRFDVEGPTKKLRSGLVDSDVSQE